MNYTTLLMEAVALLSFIFPFSALSILFGEVQTRNWTGLHISGAALSFRGQACILGSFYSHWLPKLLLTDQSAKIEGNKHFPFFEGPSKFYCFHQPGVI